MARVREDEEYVVTNRARGEMYGGLEMEAEGELDTRGRRALADVPVHYRAVRLRVTIATDEPDERIDRLADLVARYCPVDTLMRPVVPDFEVTWERKSA